MPKLWQKDYDLDTLMERFTVGQDYVIDQHLVIADALASMAHAKTIQKVGLLSQKECDDLFSGLKEVIALRNKDAFPIQRSDEDCHTAIENYLVAHYGECGKKIHSGRSRNDQVQVALRLWMRDFSLKLAESSLAFASELFRFAKQYEFVPMPGRTHMQVAMPSSVGLWAASYAEAVTDDASLLLDLEALLDQCPLGAAASYGVPLPLDRAYTASLLGFSRVQNNVLYAVSSRGSFEGMLLDHCEYLASTISKLAQDLMLFTLPELGYFSLPKELCTGSSIMPQKKNPDGLELARSRAAVVAGEAQTVKMIIRSLPSGYNRDYQDTKPPLFDGTSVTWMLVSIMEKMIGGLEVHQDRLEAGCVAPLYATDAVFAKVAQGEPFRDAYREVGLDLGSVKEPADKSAALRLRTSLGTSGNLRLDEGLSRVAELKGTIDDRGKTIHHAYQVLSGLEDIQTVLL